MEYSLPKFIPYVEKSIKEHWDQDALTDYMGATQQFKDVARIIEKLHILFEESGIKKGDKIALCGRNSANWGISFLGILTYGAVAVPILHEFKPENVHHIVNHSESKLLFVGDVVWPTLSIDEMPNLEGVIYLPDFSLSYSKNDQLTFARENLNKMYGSKYPKYFRPEHVHYEEEESGETMAMINYTSGSTGNSKGVMIPYRALASNLVFAYDVLPLKKGDHMISMLPMAHMYGMAFEFIYEFCKGCHIFFLTRLPSPKIIFQAFQEVKPKAVISVPLIIEKIIKKSVLPKLQTPTMKVLMKVPILNDKIRQKVCKQMIDAFGGDFYEVIIGGAAFNQEVETFLFNMGFPFTVGYGTTECAPILGYIDYKDFKLGTCGKAAPRMDVRINSADPQNIVGEIIAKGPNVMLGYFKNPEATAATIDKDGWYHTGDLGTIDADGYITIRGRSKNMLLGANGQNIYPEEIEDKLNNLPLVSESVVVQREDKFYALVYADPDATNGMTPEDIKTQMEQNRKDLNAAIPSYEQITAIELQAQEFEKTPKKSIKRYLYK